MSQFDQHLITFLIGGIVAAYVLYQIIKGLGIFRPYVSGGAYPVPIAGGHPTTQESSDKGLTNVLLLITILLAGMAFYKGINAHELFATKKPSSDAYTPNEKITATALITDVKKPVVEQASPAPPQAELVTTPTDFEEDSSEYTQEEVLTEKHFLQLTASSNWNRIQQKARDFQAEGFKVRIGIREGRCPYKILLGPYDSSQEVTDLKDRNSRFLNGFVCTNNEFEEIQLVEP